MLLQRKISNLPFQQWLFQDHKIRRWVLLGGTIIIFQFVIFKVLYPYPNFMPPDSYSYLDAAWFNKFINIWPIGYSKFLRLISSFSNSHYVLVLFQYLLLEVSILYFVFTIQYLLTSSEWVFLILLIAGILNPLIPHISNFISSDALFTFLSMIWFTQLIWIAHNPKNKLLVSHAVIVLLVFTVRYNSLYYPLISILIIISTKLSFRKKTMTVGLIVLLLTLFIGCTEYEYFKQTGKVQFSPFAGWQMAANALYGYAHSKQDPVEKMPEKFKALHSMVNQHMDSINKLHYRPDNEVAIYYLWDFKSPLKKYVDKFQKNDSSQNYFQKWSTVAPLYKEYGLYLIKKHPYEFLKYYIWPNLIKYYAPPSKFMGMYNMGIDTVEDAAAATFGWKSRVLATTFRDRKIKIAEPFQIISAIINIAFILTLISFLALKGFYKTGKYFRRVITIVIIVWCTNLIFSVLSAPIELRYQLFPMIITFCFMLLLLSFIMEQCGITETKKSLKESSPEVIANPIHV